MGYVGSHRALRPFLLRRPVLGGVAVALLVGGPALALPGVRNDAPTGPVTLPAGGHAVVPLDGGMPPTGEPSHRPTGARRLTGLVDLGGGHGGTLLDLPAGLTRVDAVSSGPGPTGASSPGSSPTDTPASPAPTPSPTTSPTPSPTTDPTPSPTTDPTPSPTTDPTPSPTTDPTSAPTPPSTPPHSTAPTSAPTGKADPPATTRPVGPSSTAGSTS